MTQNFDACNNHSDVAQCKFPNMYKHTHLLQTQPHKQPFDATTFFFLLSLSLIFCLHSHAPMIISFNLLFFLTLSIHLSLYLSIFLPLSIFLSLLELTLARRVTISIDFSKNPPKVVLYCHFVEFSIFTDKV